MKTRIKKKSFKHDDINVETNFTDELEMSDNEVLMSKMMLSKSSSEIMSKKKKSGGFQSMGLSYPILKGVLQKGYKVPTPIQRKAIPVILEGKDVVAMARTGSGKTGAFLIPMFEKLKTRTAKAGARALIFSPTRELAIQTMKFTKELGKHTGLKAILVLGGQKLENQFAAIHESPDIIIATPGRFLHIVMEMDLKLSSVEYVVFDEADRLFEMGFQEQIQEVLHRLPEHKQTLLFSATLPRILVDFVKAGLADPVLIRLDVEHKLSENLKTIYLCCRSSEKTAILLHLLKNVVNTTKELAVVFLATRHHVEYIKDILSEALIPCSYIYSSLDQTARRINIEKFRTKEVGVLLVTDIAARGIDIPLLDNVINYNFPAKPKLFVHRVGRVARAGRKGCAYSLVAPDEVPYLLDLHLFLGKPLVSSEASRSDQDGICGSVPQSAIDEATDWLRICHESHIDLQNMTKVCKNADKKYIKSRSAPSSESVKRAKTLSLFSLKAHPIFHDNHTESERCKLLDDMKNYRPNSTIFEIGATAKNQASSIMRQKRKYHNVIQKSRLLNSQNEKNINEEEYVKNSLVAADDGEIQSAFSVIIDDKNKSNKKKPLSYKDEEHYLSHKSTEHYSEKGLAVENTFEQQVSSAVLDLTADDDGNALKLKNAWKWDRKRKRFVREDDGEFKKKKMKTESGVWIPKSYKSGLYKKWQESNKIAFQQKSGDSNEEDYGQSEFGKVRKGMKTHSRNHKGSKSKMKRPPKHEMKSKEEILKSRKRKAKLMFHQKRRQTERTKRRKNMSKSKK